MTDPSDFDKYYTPLSIARDLLALAQGVPAPSVVVDTSCGAGHLLLASEERWPGVLVRGLDLDKEMVAILRRGQPNWDIAVGSIYPAARGPAGWCRRYRCDLLVANPPFSMEKRRFLESTFAGKAQRTGLAMAHVIAATEAFRPRLGVVAVMPESAVHSELDVVAREYLALEHEFIVGAEVHNTTFPGARARSVLCAWLRRDALVGHRIFARPRLSRRETAAVLGDGVAVVRGSLPVFRAHDDPGGPRFLHSTHLRGLRSDAGVPARRVASLGQGTVVGHTVLIARVGLPRAECVVALKIRQAVQLSDCVLSLSVASWSQATFLRRLILSEWHSFSGLYRGTGAPFITLGRLTDWLIDRGISVLPRRVGQESPIGAECVSSRISRDAS